LKLFWMLHPTFAWWKSASVVAFGFRLERVVPEAFVALPAGAVAPPHTFRPAKELLFFETSPTSETFETSLLRILLLPFLETRNLKLFPVSFSADPRLAEC